MRAKPIDGMVEMMKKLHDEGFEIHIITYPTRDSRFCSYEKYEWVRKYLPWLNTQKYLHCTGNKKLMAKENRVLIDDNVDYLESWRSHNGVSICYGDYGWNEDYKGFKVLNSIDLYDLIWTMEKGIIK